MRLIFSFLFTSLIFVSPTELPAQESELCKDFTRLAPPSWSKANNLIAFGGDCGNADINGLYIYDPVSGSLSKLDTGDLFVDTASWSNSGKKIGFSAMMDSGLFNLFVIDLETQQLTGITNDESHGGYISWSFDDEWLGTYGKDDEHWNLYKVRADGTDHTRLNTDNDIDLFNLDWSRDNLSYLYSASGVIYLVQEGADEPSRVTPPGVSGYMPKWSQDNQWLVFDGSEGDDWQLYRINLDGTGLTRLTDIPRGTNASFSPDGTEIVYECEIDDSMSLCFLNLDNLEVRPLFRR